MAIVKKENVELKIAENLVDEYLENGYSLLDSRGNVVRRKKTDVDVIDELKTENLSLKETIERLTEEINALKTSHINSDETLDDVPSNNTSKKSKANRND